MDIPVKYIRAYRYTHTAEHNLKLTFYTCTLVLTNTYFPSMLYLQDLQPTWPEHHPLSWPGYLHLKKRPQNKSIKSYTTCF